MTYQEAFEKFSAVLEFLAENDEIKPSYAAPLNALKNNLEFKAKVGSASRRGKTAHDRETK